MSITFSQAAELVSPFFGFRVPDSKARPIVVTDADGEVEWVDCNDRDAQGGPFWLPHCTELHSWTAIIDGTLILTSEEEAELDVLNGWQWAEVEKQARQLVENKARR